MSKTNALEEFFRQAFEEKLSVKMPERETDHLTAASKVLEKRREMAEVESNLNAQKEEFQMKVESLQQRKDDLEKKELQLKESLVKFDKFLKENEIKRARANKKAHEEKDLSTQKEKEIKRLQDDIQKHLELRERLYQRIDRDRIYQTFLDSLVSTGEDFGDVTEVTKRWATLTSASNELVMSSANCQKQLDEIKKDFKHYLHEKNNQIVGYNNTLAGLQSKLDAAVAVTMNLDSQWNHIKNTAARKTLMLGKVKVSVNNLYALVQRHARLPTTKPGVDEDDDDMDDYHAVHTVGTATQDEQLDRVRQYLVNLTEIVNEVKRVDNLGRSTAEDYDEEVTEATRLKRRARRK